MNHLSHTRIVERTWFTDGKWADGSLAKILRAAPGRKKLYVGGEWQAYLRRKPQEEVLR